MIMLTRLIFPRQDDADQTITEKRRLVNPDLIISVDPHKHGASVALRGLNSNMIVRETDEEIYNAIEDYRDKRAAALAQRIAKYQRLEMLGQVQADKVPSHGSGLGRGPAGIRAAD